MMKNIHQNLPQKKRFYISGTDIIDGDPELDIVSEYAYTPEMAFAQAVAHAAGTSFTPEKVEN